MEEVIQLIQQKYQLTDKEMLRDMVEHMTIYHAKKGEKIITEGEKQTNIYFLISGIIRGFYFSEQGKEITDCFVYEPGEIIASDLLEESRATITEQALAESELAANADFRDLSADGQVSGNHEDLSCVYEFELVSTSKP